MNFSAGLLVGGRSSRMGRDKAFHEIDGIPLWQRQLQILRELGPSEIFLAGPAQPKWIKTGVEIVADAVDDAGPLGGLVAVLRRCRNAHLLALAVDLPNMTTQFLEQLFVTCTRNSGVVPKRCGASFQLANQKQRNLKTCATQFEPLAAIYPASCLALAEDCLTSGDFSLQQLVRRATKAGLMTTKEIADGEEHLFFNLNTPADLAAVGNQ